MFGIFVQQWMRAQQNKRTEMSTTQIKSEVIISSFDKLIIGCFDDKTVRGVYAIVSWWIFMHDFMPRSLPPSPYTVEIHRYYFEQMREEKKDIFELQSARLNRRLR